MKAFIVFLLLQCLKAGLAELCSIVQGLNCNGDDLINSAGPVKSAADCCAFCQKTVGCNAWTWNSAGNKVCYAKAQCSHPAMGQSTVGGRQAAPPPPSPDFPWNDPTKPADARADALLAALSTQEKIGMMVTSSRVVPRLAVGSFEWSNEGLHGIAWHGRSTVFPAPIGLGASFDHEVVADLGRVDAKEGRAKFYHGDGNGISLFAPNINIFRDPRWGRGQETYGEDPILAGELAVSFVKSAQTPFVNTSALPVLMTDKHYVVYNLESNYAPPLNGTDGQYRLRFYATATETDLALTYLVPHAYAVKAGVSAVMCAYNAVNGLPNCANGPLLRRLREELEFEGVVVTDCGAIGFSVSPMQWTDSHVNATAAALIAGTDLNCGGEYSDHLQEALNSRLVDEALLDKRLRKSLIARIRTGNLDKVDPYRSWYDSDPQMYSKIVDGAHHRSLASRAAERSLVLLRNEVAENGKALLPLTKDMKIALLGPNANSVDALMSNYAGCRSGAGGPIDPKCHLITILEGLKSQAPNVMYAPGCELDSADTSGIKAAAGLAAKADVAIVVLGLKSCQETGPMCQEAEAHDRRDIGLPGMQEQLLRVVVAANPNTVLVLLNGGAISGNFYISVPAVIEAFYPGAMGGMAVSNALFGSVSPAGRLPYTIVESIADLPYDYYSMNMADAPGRTYRYFEKEPGFAFGFGLSYTRFAYRDVHAAYTGQSGDIVVAGSVSNVGSAQSDEVVMCFFVHPDATKMMRGAPNLGLVGFQRIHDIPAGTSRRFSITVSARALAASGVEKVDKVSHLHVGGRKPGSTGKWTGSSLVPQEPLVVQLSTVPDTFTV